MVHIVGWHKLIQRLITVSHRCGDFCSPCLGHFGVLLFLATSDSCRFLSLSWQSMYNHSYGPVSCYTDLPNWQKHCKGKQSAHHSNSVNSDSHFRLNTRCLLCSSSFSRLSLCGWCSAFTFCCGIYVVFNTAEISACCEPFEPFWLFKKKSENSAYNYCLEPCSCPALV